MSWKLTMTRNATFYIAIIRDPEFSDTEDDVRRQKAGETDGGQVYVQDLGVEDQFLTAVWEFLDNDEVAGVKKFFRDGSKYRCFPFKLTVTGGSLPTEISSDQIVDGEQLTTDDGCDFTTDQEVSPDGEAILPEVFLDQDTITYAQQERNGLRNVELRFRIQGSLV